MQSRCLESWTYRSNRRNGPGFRNVGQDWRFGRFFGFHELV